MRSTGTTGSGEVYLAGIGGLYGRPAGEAIAEPIETGLGEVCNVARSAAADVQLTTGFQEPLADHFF